MKTHKIIFKDKKVEWVSEKEYFGIEKEGIKNPMGSFYLGRNRYLFEDIGRMEAPTKRHAFDINQYIARKTPANRLKSIESIAKGLKNYINSSRYKGTQAPIKMLDRFREVYKEVKLISNK